MRAATEGLCRPPAPRRLRDRPPRIHNATEGGVHMTTLCTTALALLASAATLAAGSALAQTATAKPATCLVMGKEIPKAADTACPADVLATLRAYNWEVTVPKLDTDGKPVLDKDGRSEERRGGNKWMSTGKSGWSPDYIKKKNE